MNTIQIVAVLWLVMAIIAELDSREMKEYAREEYGHVINVAWLYPLLHIVLFIGAPYFFFKYHLPCYYMQLHARYTVWKVRRKINRMLKKRGLKDRV